MDRTFDCMGTQVRLIGDDVPEAEEFARRAAAALTRFDPASDLSRGVRSPLLDEALQAAERAYEISGGLVDHRLGDEIVGAGYDRTHAELELVPLAEALALAPPRRPARPAATRGRSLDLGGSAKGWMADVLVERLGIDVADVGGDIRVREPITVLVEHPLHGELTPITVTDAVATSGLARRVWRTSDGGVAHHLLDPSTGAPAWTGLAGATALAPTALEAEALAKAAYLLGSAEPLVHGGALLHEDGRTELRVLAEVAA